VIGVGREHENSQGPMSIALCYLKLHAKIVYVNPRQRHANPAAAATAAAVAWPRAVYRPGLRRTPHGLLWYTGRWSANGVQHYTALQL